MDDRDVMRILEEIVDRTCRGVPYYLIAISIVAGVNLLGIYQLPVGANYPESFLVFFFVAPLYLLFMPFVCVMIVVRAKSKFYRMYWAIMVERRRHDLLGEYIFVPDRTSAPDSKGVHDTHARSIDLRARHREDLRYAQSCAKTVDVWWQRSLLAFFIYVSLTLLLIYVQLWFAR
jgi:hypothetical protein